MANINREIEQGSDEWYVAKLGKPSASNASRVITSQGARSKSLVGYSQELGGELYAGSSMNEWKGNAATEFGKEMEEEARLAYSFKYDCEIEQCGFIEDDARRYLISPDGLIEDDGLVEIKNKPKLHLDTLIFYKKHGDIPTDYKSQLQMQLLISEREYVDIFYYSAKLPCLCVKVLPDSSMHRALKMHLAEVIKIRDETLEILKSFK